MAKLIDIQGVIFKKLMGLSGLSEEILGDRVDSNRTTLNNYVRSNRVDPDILKKVEQVVGVTLDELETFLQKGKVSDNTLNRGFLNEGQDINKLREERDTLKDKLLKQHDRYEALETKYNDLEKRFKELEKLKKQA